MIFLVTSAVRTPEAVSQLPVLGGISTGRMALLGLALLALLLVTGSLKRWLIEVGKRSRRIDPGKSQAVLTIGHYLIVLIGTLTILRLGGVDLASLAVVAGALSLGIGFGLQTIIHNFVSGLIILLERPLKVGDRIQIEGVTGTVARISFRATVVVTNDNIDVIVPNSQLISSTVINWTQTDRSVRFLVPIGVSYGADPREVIKTLLDIARTHPGVLEDPEPDVLLESFGDSAMNFQLRVWTREYTDKPGVLRSQLNLGIQERFNQLGIEIPFPQRVVRMIGENPR